MEPAPVGVAEAINAIVFAAVARRVLDGDRPEEETGDWLAKVLRGAASDRLIVELCQRVGARLLDGRAKAAWWLVNQDISTSARVLHAKADRDVLRQDLQVAVWRALGERSEIKPEQIADKLSLWAAAPRDVSVIALGDALAGREQATPTSEIAENGGEH